MRSLWTNRRYIAWLISDTAKGLATGLFSFAIPLIALLVTDDPAQAGVIAGVGMVVRLVVLLYGGVLADRHDRISLMLFGAGIAAILSLGFTVLALGEALTFATLLLVEVLLVARAGLFEPASESALKEIVPAETMGRAQAANQARDAILQLGGGPLGGALLVAGAWLVGVVMTVAYTFSAVTAWMLRRMTPPQADRDERDAISGAADDAASDPTPSAEIAPARNALREIREGFAFLFSRADLSGVLWVTTVINLGFSAGTTTVIFALQQDGHSELTIGWLSAVLGGSMLLGALIAPLLVPRIGAGILTITGLCIITVGTGVLAGVREPWAIAIVLGASVFLLPALNSGMMGYFMVATPSRLLGRANSAAGFLGMGAMPLAPLIAGFGLPWIGRGGTMLFAAAVCLIAPVLAIGSRPLRAIPAEPGWVAHSGMFDRDAEVSRVAK